MRWSVNPSLHKGKRKRVKIKREKSTSCLKGEVLKSISCFNNNNKNNSSNNKSNNNNSNNNSALLSKNEKSRH